MFNVQKKWNIMIAFHPSFSEWYYNSQKVLNQIKNAWDDNDIISLFTYSKTNLKWPVKAQKASCINFEENFDAYSYCTADRKRKYCFNVFERMDHYIAKMKNKRSIKTKFWCPSFRNLFIAFTSNKEWENSDSDDLEKLLDQYKIDNQKKNSFLLLILIIVFPVK